VTTTTFSGSRVSSRHRSRPGAGQRQGRDTQASATSRRAGNRKQEWKPANYRARSVLPALRSRHPSGAHRGARGRFGLRASGMPETRFVGDHRPTETVVPKRSLLNLVALKACLVLAPTQREARGGRGPTAESGAAAFISDPMNISGHPERPRHVLLVGGRAQPVATSLTARPLRGGVLTRGGRSESPAL
jgi:hypothetical protein